MRWFAQPPGPMAAPLQARLLPPDSEPLLKNTLDHAGLRTSRFRSRETRKSNATVASRVRQGVARRKLAEHPFYPPEAVARSLEGEVRLLLTLDPQGMVLEARVASGSGHALLDRAAVEAAFAMRRIPADGVRELILPVVFKLE